MAKQNVVSLAQCDFAGLKKMFEMENFIKLPEPPGVGAKVVLPFIPSPNQLPTVGEVQQVYKKGEELWATVKAARADGKIEMHEVLLIITKGVEFAGLSFWQKVGRFFRNLFTRKKS